MSSLSIDRIECVAKVERGQAAIRAQPSVAINKSLCFALCAGSRIGVYQNRTHRPPLVKLKRAATMKPLSSLDPC
jgi:hypothetical protein